MFVGVTVRVAAAAAVVGVGVLFMLVSLLLPFLVADVLFLLLLIRGGH